MWNGNRRSATTATGYGNGVGPWWVSQGAVTGDTWTIWSDMPPRRPPPRSRRERRMLAALASTKKGRRFLENQIARAQRLADERKMADAILARAIGERLATHERPAAAPEQSAAIDARAAALRLR